MKEELYRQALSLFNNGDYEKALNILKQNDGQISSIKERQLIDQCEKQITEQYYYLIHECIQQEDYLNAHTLQNEYKVKFGNNARIAEIRIPERKIVPSTQIIEEEEEKRFPYGWLITLIVLLVFFGFLYWQYNRGTNTTSSNQEQTHEESKSESESFEERSEAIIAQLTEEYGGWLQVLYKYPELSKYCAFSLTENETEYLLIYDLEKRILKRFESCNLPTTNAGEIYLPYLLHL